MIIVTGTKRSGTSMWMQILIAAGFEHVGGAFPGVWQVSIGEDNPEGFYESMFRDGVYYKTNPHPKTGQFLFPAKSIELVAKVFIPGLVRTDYAFLNRVVATVRPWREYCASLTALLERERAFFAERRARKGDEAPPPELPRSELPAPVVWWSENYALIRDLATRRYPYYLCSHGGLLRDPPAVVAEVLRFLGRGDREAASRVVQPELHRKRAVDWPTDQLHPLDVEFFDQLYDVIDRRGAFTPEILRAANETNQRITSRIGPPRKKTARA